MSRRGGPPGPERRAPPRAARLSRARFLSLGLRGGAALAAGGSVLALAACDGAGDGADEAARERSGTAPAGRVDDTALAMLAATAELLAVDFYSRAIEALSPEGALLGYLRSARENERDHYDALAEALGAEAPSDLAFTYPAGTFASLESAAATGMALEAAFVGTYMGAVTALRDPALRALAARIGANEAQHLAALSSIAAGGDMPLAPAPALPEVLTAREATEAVSPFLT